MRKLLADFVSLNTILSICSLLFGVKLLKSDIFRGVLLSVTMYFILALIADSTPSGAFSTIIASDGIKLNFSSAV